MDYEKAYKEALERARKFYSEPHLDSNSVIEDIFPELFKSEDERIRRELIDCIKRSMKGMSDSAKVTYNSWIDWVKKQGEQKPIIAENEKWLIDETLYFLDEFQHSDKCYSEQEMQNSVTCRNWLKSLKEKMGG